LSKDFKDQLSEISSLKQQFLWEQIISSWLKDQNKIYSDQLGKLHDNDSLDFSLSVPYTPTDSWYLSCKAKEAFAILQMYQIPLDSIKRYVSCKENKVFLEWLSIYIDLCNKFNYYNQPVECSFNNIKHIISSIKHKANNENHFKIACQDINQEIEYAAKFCLSNSSKKTAFVTINLEDDYDKIDYIFSNYFKKHEYEIYFSPKLSEQYNIRIALLMLQLANCYITKEKFKYEDFSKLLRTKYISGSLKELTGRIYVDYILRGIVDYIFDWKYIIDYLLIYLGKPIVEPISIFVNLCISFTTAIDNKYDWLHEKQRCGFWVEFINEILTAFGWCIEVHEFDSQEEQVLACWRDLLQQYNDLEEFVLPHDFSECIKIINKLSQIYKIKNHFNDNINVMVMDLQTALQYKFDFLWIAGFSEINWPLEYEFNPFLPVDLQKRFGVPYGSLQSSQAISQQFLEQLIGNTTNNVICSYPIYIDGNLVRPSNLIKDFLEYNVNLNLDFNYNNKVDVIGNELDLELYTDEYAPKYEFSELPGTKVFQIQNLCPFQANAKIRLKANKIIVPVPYLNKATKGEVLHKTLASFWLLYRNQSGLNMSSSVLKNLSLYEIKEALFKITYKILEDLRRSKPTTLNKVTMDLEANRIVNLCFDFINKYDLHRSDFDIIHVEEKFTVKLKDYSINVKIDRIDKLLNGNLIIIDYKTGFSVDIADFKLFDIKQIDNHQFIVYSLYSKEVKGLILANIRPDELKLIGAIDSQANLDSLYNLPDSKYIAIDDWDKHLINCYEDLYKIATSFKEGYAAVKPKYGSSTCKKCDLHSICRVYIDN
jgi:ATP-dependent helicase/nuclease subunit B